MNNPNRSGVKDGVGLAKPLGRLSVLAAALFASTRPLAACPVCFVAEQRTLNAYFGTAALLSVLPFLLFGMIGLLYWRERRLVRRREEDLVASAGADSGSATIPAGRNPVQARG